MSEVLDLIPLEVCSPVCILLKGLDKQAASFGASIGVCNFWQIVRFYIVGLYILLTSFSVKVWIKSSIAQENTALQILEYYDFSANGSNLLCVCVFNSGTTVFF